MDKAVETDGEMGALVCIIMNHHKMLEKNIVYKKIMCFFLFVFPFVQVPSCF